MRKVIFTIVVVLFLGGIIAVVFAMRWAIVTGRAKRQRADAEYEAIQHIRTIFHAQRQYFVSNEYLGFTCTLSTLSAKPDQFLDDKFAAGHADGYTFTLSDCRHDQYVGFNGNLAYRLTATPDPGSALPLRTFCTDDDIANIPRGEVVFDHPRILASTPGSSICTQPLAEATTP
jgi:hypothetical protein